MLSWILQLVVLSLGIWVPLMYLLGAVFIAMWAWGMIAGGTIDKARAAKNKLDSKESEV
jgi:hypothetical protein